MSKETRQVLHRKFTIVATMVILVTLMATGFGKVYLDDIKNLQIQKEQRTKDVLERQWDFIAAIVSENLMRAELQAKNIKFHTNEEINAQYRNNKDLLKEDLINPTIDSKITQIFTEQTAHKYLNIDNDNNDPFIMVVFGMTSDENGSLTPKGYIASDKSVNCAKSFGEMRSLKDEIEMHANPNVAYEAIMTMATNNTTSKLPEDRVWQFLNPKSKDLFLSESSMEAVKEKYDLFGLDALKSIEFIHNEYIEDHMGIFGVTDVNALGIKQDNIKIVIAQGFNPYDALTKHHKTALYAFDNNMKTIEIEINRTLKQKKLIVSLLIITWLIVVISTIALQNALADILELERRNG